MILAVGFTRSAGLRYSRSRSGARRSPTRESMTSNRQSTGCYAVKTPGLYFGTAERVVSGERCSSWHANRRRVAQRHRRRRLSKRPRQTKPHPHDNDGLLGTADTFIEVKVWLTLI